MNATYLKLETIAIVNIQRLINAAEIDLKPSEFIALYSSNRGIKNNPVNVWQNIEKYQLFLEGNYKYLYQVLGDPLNFLNGAVK